MEGESALKLIVAATLNVRVQWVSGMGYGLGLDVAAFTRSAGRELPGAWKREIWEVKTSLSLQRHQQKVVRPQAVALPPRELLEDHGHRVQPRPSRPRRGLPAASQRVSARPRRAAGARFSLGGGAVVPALPEQ